MKNYFLGGFFWMITLTALPACKKERCLQCTTVVSGIKEMRPEICDTDSEVLDAEQEKLQDLVDDFVKMGWSASVSCERL
ncbi:MAG: hypothetical protein AAFW73_16805 [Bacteroidota bacterium]